MTAYKNRGIRTEHHWKEAPLLVTMIGMLCSLLISRATLSTTTILFLLLAIVRKDFNQQWKTFRTNPFLLLFTLLFFIPFVSGLWSENLSKWSDVVRLKLPLLFFPLAFSGNWNFSKKGWLLLSVMFIAVVAAGCSWSLWHYFQNITAVHEGYLRAKTLLTPLENDHVRFSWLVSVGVLVCILLANSITQKAVTVLLWILALFFITYLHVLSARTGMISLYIFLLLYAGWALFKERRVRTAGLLITVLLALPALAYFTVPTFQNRIRYLVYDFSFVKKAAYLPGANDGARVMSIKAGWQVLQQHPFGAGAGDVMQEANKWYTANVPGALATDKFYPSSEWLLYGAFAGWIGVALFSVVMLLPFFVKIPRYKIFWLALHATAAFSFAFDMGLEVQYGVFLYAFVTFWWWKWLRTSHVKCET